MVVAGTGLRMFLRSAARVPRTQCPGTVLVPLARCKVSNLTWVKAVVTHRGYPTCLLPWPVVKNWIAERTATSESEVCRWCVLPHRYFLLDKGDSLTTAARGYRPSWIPHVVLPGCYCIMQHVVICVVVDVTTGHNFVRDIEGSAFRLAPNVHLT